MQNFKKLFVFTSLRRIREFIKGYENALVPKAMSIGEFFARAVFVNELSTPSDAERLLFMRQACLKTSNANKKLGIPEGFFEFLKNNDYLFSFFKEITHQKKSIESLKFSDIYADYEEHIEILSNVFENYKLILKSQGFYDDITLPEIYNINEDFIRAFTEIDIEIDGILSEFEWEILIKISSFTTLNIIFKALNLNTKLTSKLCKIANFEQNPFKNYHKVKFNLSKFQIIEQIPKPQNKTVLTRSFNLRSLQALYVLEKISTFVREGIKPENIAVILPDESFSEILKLYDKQNFLSYAMGKPFYKSQFFAVLECIFICLKDQKSINLNKEILNSQTLKKDETFLNLTKLNQGLFDKFKILYSQRVNFNEFSLLLNELCEIYGDAEIKKVLNEELFFMRELLDKNELKFKEAVQFLLIRLQNVSLDEVGGGAVRVMGILESRGLSYEGVIIVDFNDDLVPKRAINEMFLSSKVRAKAGLISYTERENLQRSYYENLINEAKKVAISYATNDSRIASRFLNEFNVIVDDSYSDDEYLGLLTSGKTANFIHEKVFLDHDFFAKELSFSRLNTLLICPRKYYYAYVLNLKDARVLDKNTNNFYGNAIHKALFIYYSKFKSFVLDDFLEILKSQDLNPLEFEIAKLKFQKFQQVENENFKDGWRILELESEKKAVVNGVKIKGVIDRIDECNGVKRVIDYKTGSSKEPLQLLFYKFLVGDECEAYFYDLKDSMSLETLKHDESEFLEAIHYAKEYFSTKPNFESKHSTACSYCSFYAICRGEI